MYGIPAAAFLENPAVLYSFLHEVFLHRRCLRIGQEVYGSAGYNSQGSVVRLQVVCGEFKPFYNRRRKFPVFVYSSSQNKNIIRIRRILCVWGQDEEQAGPGGDGEAYCKDIEYCPDFSRKGFCQRGFVFQSEYPAYNEENPGDKPDVGK